MLKLEQLSATGLLLIQQAFKFGNAIKILVISFGSFTLLPHKLICSTSGLNFISFNDLMS